MSSNLESALVYASLGWAVFPLVDKVPVTSRGFHDATTNPDQITAWWSAMPEAWIGVALRASGMIVIDSDVDHGKDGAATLARLEARYGALPRDLVQQSGRGGRHIFLADPSPGPNGWTRNADQGGEIRGRADRLGCGLNVDFKCNGYVLLEPSGAYRWLTDLNEAPPVPDGWIAALRKPQAELGSAPDADGIEVWAESSDPGVPFVDSARLRDDLAQLGPRASGKSTTFSAVLRIFHDYGLSVADGYPFLIDWNSHSGKPRSEHDLHRQIEKIAESGRAQGARGNRRSNLTGCDRVVRANVPPGAVTPAVRVTAIRQLEHVEDVLATVAAIPETAAVDTTAQDWPTLLYVAGLEVAARLAEDTTVQQSSDAIAPMFESARSLFGRVFPEDPMLIGELLPEHSVAVLGGEPKTAKTWAASETCIALATGTPAFGKFPITRPRRAAYFYAEDGGPSVQRRLLALAATRNKVAPGWEDRLFAQPRGRSVDLVNDRDIAILIASVRMLGGVDLLVLDPLRDIHSGEEDNSDSMRPILHRMRVIGDLLDCAVMFVHHTAKPSADNSKRRQGQRLRGSGAIYGAVDCGIYLWDLRGDGRNEFTSAVTGELRTGRSAGDFDLTLNLTDNKYGQAEKAAWKVAEREAPPTIEERVETTLADVLTTMFDHTAPITEIVLHKKIGGKRPVLTACLETAKREKLIAPHIVGTTNMGWTLTPRGLEFVRGGAAPEPAIVTPAPHPATRAICDVLPKEK